MKDIKRRIEDCINEYYYLQIEYARENLIKKNRKFKELHFENEKIENDLNIFDTLHNITKLMELCKVEDMELFVAYLRNKVELDFLLQQELFKLGYIQGLSVNINQK